MTISDILPAERELPSVARLGHTPLTPMEPGELVNRTMMMRKTNKVLSVSLSTGINIIFLKIIIKLTVNYMYTAST